MNDMTHTIALVAGIGLRPQPASAFPGGCGWLIGVPARDSLGG